MKSFAYVRADNEGAAFMHAPSARSEVIAGGTGVVDLWRLGVEQPDVLVDINRLPWTRIERAEGGGLRIGSLVKNSDLADHPDVRTAYPVLSEALLSGASPQLRNMASVGGNLLQRTRCPYFRDIAVPECNKRLPGSGCAAAGHPTRLHAVLGGSDRCIAVHPSDMCVAMLALDAVVHLQGPRGERDVAIDDFHVVPGDHPDVESVLAKGELASYITLPDAPFSRRSAYVKARDRASYAFALASAAAGLDVGGGTIRSARLALGGVATKPWRARDAERELIGKAPSRALFERAAAAAVAGAQPRPGIEFKVELAKRVVVRALERAGGAA